MKRSLALPARVPAFASATLWAAVLAFPCSIFAADAAPAASTSTAAASTPSTTTSVLTADAVQEAFVRVADRVRASVVSIESTRNIRLDASAAGKPGSKPDPLKPGSKPAPKVNPQPDPQPDPEADPDEGDGDEPNPFGLPFGPKDPRDRRQALGTGMVISKDGFVLTNYHVVRGAAYIRVLFNPDAETPEGSSALLIGYDEEADLAVLKLLKPPATLQPVEFADSDAVRIGEWALAIGSPFQQAQTVTVGVVSAKSRHLESKDRTASLQDYIQTDASINPGNSGGPLFNLDGKVIGINTAILSPSRFNVGIGFSVPSNTIRTLLPVLFSGKAVERGFVGISYMKLNPGVAAEFGLQGGMHIGALATNDKGLPEGPAKAAGLLVDDIITHVDGKPVGSVEEFRRLISGQRPGTTLALRIARPTATGVEAKDISLKLGARPGKKLVFPSLRIEPTASALGLEVQDASKLSADEREVFKLGAGARGVIVSDVIPGSSADEAEVLRGLRIVRARVNGGAWQPVTTKAAFEKLEAGLAPGSRLLLQMRDIRDNHETSIYNLIVAPGKSAGNVS